MRMAAMAARVGEKSAVIRGPVYRVHTAARQILHVEQAHRRHRAPLRRASGLD
jgi:hypothetical protein